jgi:hypothetical protein
MTNCFDTIHRPRLIESRRFGDGTVWDPLLYKYVFNCHTTMVLLPWLPTLTLDGPRLCRFCVHLRNLNLCYFKLVEAIGLKLRRRGHHGMTSPLNFIKIYQLVQKVLTWNRLVISRAPFSYFKRKETKYATKTLQTYTIC